MGRAINSENLTRLGMTVDEVFDVCKNLSAAALILEDNFTRASAKEGAPQEALKKALSAYNTGDFARGIKNGGRHRSARTDSRSPRATQSRPSN